MRQLPYHGIQVKKTILKYSKHFLAFTLLSIIWSFSIAWPTTANATHPLEKDIAYYPCIEDNFTHTNPNIPYKSYNSTLSYTLPMDSYNSSQSLWFNPEHLLNTFKNLLAYLSPSHIIKHKILYSPIWQCIALVILTIVISITYKIIAFLLRFILQKWTFISDKKKAFMRWLVFVLIASFFLKTSIIVLGLKNFDHFINRILNIIISLASTYFIYECIGLIQDQIKTKYPHNKHIFHMLPLYSMTIKVIVILVGIVSTLDSFGFNTESLVKVLSMSTLGIGLAVQDPIKNLFASFMITMDNPFNIGDDIAYGSIRGKVEEIGLRATLIRTKEGSLVYIPNTKLAESSIDNFGKRNERVVFLEVPLSYDIPLQELPKFVRALRSIVKHQRYIKQNKTVIYLDHMHEKGFKIMMKLHLDTQKKEIEYECKNNVIFLTLKVAHNLKIQLGSIDHFAHIHTPPYKEEPSTDLDLEQFSELSYTKK